MERLEDNASEATAGRSPLETARGLEAHVWAEYFASIARVGSGVLAAVQVVSGAGAGELAEHRRPLQGIGYDAARDVLELAVGAHSAAGPMLRYFIAAPRAIDVAEAHDRTTLLISDESRLRTQISLYNLPARPSVGARPTPLRLASRRRRDGR